MFMVAFLVWSSSLGGCHGRATGKHWSKNRVASATHSSKKGKAHSHGGGHNGNRRGGASKTKPPSTKPKQDVPPSLPPQKGGGGFKGGHSSMFNVLNFGARGDGVTDDTKVRINSIPMKIAMNLQLQKSTSNIHEYMHCIC